MRSGGVSEADWGEAVTSVVRGRAGAAERLGMMLLAAARSDDPDLVDTAERTLANAEPRLWTALDVAARRSWWNIPDWTSLAGQRIRVPRPRSLDLVLAACHPDGHVREAAVALITERAEPMFAPVLALRAADWVPQVRDRARSACQRQLTGTLADAVRALGPVAFVLDRRGEGGWLAGALRDLLRDGPDDVLAAGIAARDRLLRRAAYRAGLDTGRLGPDQLVRAALADPDLPIRRTCADAITRHANTIGEHSAIRALLASRTASIRAGAVHTLGQAGNTEPALAALLDRHPLVRATAQAVVCRSGVDPAAHYRLRVTGSGPPDPAAIAGLGETGTGADADLLGPWPDHPRSRGRAETVRALRRLGAEPIPLLAELLADPSAAVVRQVVVSLRAHVNELDEQRLWGLLVPQRARHVRVGAGRLLRARDAWARVTVDLQLVTDPDPALREAARVDLVNWLDHDAATTYTAPTEARRKQISALLPRAEASIGADRVRRLRFHLGPTG